MSRSTQLSSRNRKVIIHGNTLVLTALGVMFCSGYTAEQQTPAAKERTEVVGSVKAQLEDLGARIRVNEQSEIARVYRINTQITDTGLVHLEGLTSLQYLWLSHTEITDAGVTKLRPTTNHCDKSLTHLTSEQLQNIQAKADSILEAIIERLEGSTELQFAVRHIRRAACVAKRRNLSVHSRFTVNFLAHPERTAISAPSQSMYQLWLIRRQMVRIPQASEYLLHVSSLSSLLSPYSSCGSHGCCSSIGKYCGTISRL